VGGGFPTRSSEDGGIAGTGPPTTGLFKTSIRSAETSTTRNGCEGRPRAYVDFFSRLPAPPAVFVFLGLPFLEVAKEILSWLLC
jgi:hypothetical protein